MAGGSQGLSKSFRGVCDHSEESAAHLVEHLCRRHGVGLYDQGSSYAPTILIEPVGVNLSDHCPSLHRSRGAPRYWKSRVREATGDVCFVLADELDDSVRPGVVL